MYLTKYWHLCKWESGKTLLFHLLLGYVVSLGKSKSEVWNLIVKEKFSEVSLADIRYFKSYGFIWDNIEQEKKAIQTLIREYKEEMEEKPIMYGIHANAGKESSMDTENMKQVFHFIQNLNRRRKENSWLMLYEADEMKAKEMEAFFQMAQKHILQQREHGKKSAVILWLTGMKDEKVFGIIKKNKSIIKELRICCNENGKQKLMIEEIQSYLQMNVSVSLWFYVNRRNIKDIPAMAELIVDKSWHKNPHFCCYLLPETGGVCDLCEWEIIHKLKEIDKRTDGLMSCVFSLDNMKGYQHLKRLFSMNQNFQKSISLYYCDCVPGKQYVFGGDGKIYLCPKLCGKISSAIGSYDNGFRRNWKKEKQWKLRNVQNMEECRKCKFAFICAGGCGKKAIEQGDLTKAVCSKMEMLIREYFGEGGEE